MALVSCPECEKQISDKAISCPSCGYPLGEEHTAAEPVSALGHKVQPAAKPAKSKGCLAGVVKGAALAIVTMVVVSVITLIIFLPPVPQQRNTRAHNSASSTSVSTGPELVRLRQLVQVNDWQLTVLNATQAYDTLRVEVQMGNTSDQPRRPPIFEVADYQGRTYQYEVSSDALNFRLSAINPYTARSVTLTYVVPHDGSYFIEVPRRGQRDARILLIEH